MVEEERVSDENEVASTEVVSETQPAPFKMITTLTVLAEQGVEIPDHPLDLSHVLAEEGITHTFIIVTMGRTGSTWLADGMMRATG